MFATAALGTLSIHSAAYALVDGQFWSGLYPIDHFAELCCSLGSFLERVAIKSTMIGVDFFGLLQSAFLVFG
ncbi:hypothetical protein [Synechococcus sp. CS-197]|uniref:hypothetical protein n=1 Tax=Synechococcus sp. CS-197 TaxID=2847985 RepID=UPI0003036517|nr:hypothetical protein [Synechococcus sp. CS-197]